MTIRNGIILLGTVLALGGAAIILLISYRQCKGMPMVFWSDCFYSLLSGMLGYYAGIMLVTLGAYVVRENNHEE